MKDDPEEKQAEQEPSEQKESLAGKVRDLFGTACRILSARGLYKKAYDYVIIAMGVLIGLVATTLVLAILDYAGAIHVFHWPGERKQYAADANSGDEADAGGDTDAFDTQAGGASGSNVDGNGSRNAEDSGKSASATEEDAVHYVVFPADYVNGSVTQDSLDESAGDGFISATLNEDGSVTYELTRDQFDEMRDSIAESVEAIMENLISDGGNSITAIEHDENYATFRVTLSGNTVTEGDEEAADSLLLASELGNMFAEQTVEQVTVILVDQSGNLLWSIAK